MTKTTSLEFQGQKMAYTFQDNQFWVAIKPICEALNVNYNRQFQNLKSDEILSQLFAKQQIVAADFKRREMICLPEKYIYGWLFSIRSDNPLLIEYKKKCYDVLFTHFNGSITQRRRMLQEKASIVNKIKELEEKLSENPDYLELTELKSKRTKQNNHLQQLDQDLISGQLDLFQKLLNK